MLILDYPNWDMLGRPTVPVRVFIRMMVLKFYLCISFEDLSIVVTKTPMYKRFCHIPMDLEAPTDTAMMKFTKKYGDEIIKQLNESFILELRKNKVIKGRKVLIDSTVIESNIAYPTDAELLFKEVQKLENQMTAVREQCGHKVRKSIKKTKKMKEKLLNINKIVIRRTNETIQAVGTVIEQTELVNAGGKPENRIVSIADTDARPISKGKLGMRVEFGHVLQLEEIAESLITG